MQGLSEENATIVQNWIIMQVREKVNGNQVDLYYWNQLQNCQLFKVTEIGERHKIFMIEVKIEVITPQDVDYWLISQGASIPKSKMHQIMVNGQVQYVLIFIKTKCEKTFWYSKERRINEKLDQLENECRNQSNQSTRKLLKNQTCSNLEQLSAWNEHKKISLYKYEIGTKISGSYHGYISNKVVQVIQLKNFEEITIKLFQKKSKIQTIKLVNLFWIENGIYQFKNISIDIPGALDLLVRNDYSRLFKDNYKAYFRNFAHITTVRADLIRSNQYQLDKYSILLTDRKNWIPFQHAGVYIGGNQVMDFLPGDRDMFQARSLNDFLDTTQEVVVYSFSQRLVSDDRIHEKLQQLSANPGRYSLGKNNCECLAFEAVIGIHFSPQVEESFFSYLIIWYYS